MFQLSVCPQPDGSAAAVDRYCRGVPSSLGLLENILVDVGVGEIAGELDASSSRRGERPS
jgi:hypothetical protein